MLVFIRKSVPFAYKVCPYVKRCLSCERRRRSVLFFGTDDFSLAHLESLAARRDLHSLEVVVSSKAMTSPVSVYANKHGITRHDWKPDISFAGDFDIGVVVSFGHFIPSHVINAFRLGMINVHPSLLPRWRGTMPIEHAILYDPPVTGVTIQTVSPEAFDQGDVLLQRVVRFSDRCMKSELQSALATTGAQCLNHVMDNFEECLRTASSQQDVAPAVADILQQAAPRDAVTSLEPVSSLSRKLDRSHSWVDFRRQGDDVIHRQYRALSERHRLRARFRDGVLLLKNIVPPEQLDYMLSHRHNAQHINPHTEPGAMSLLRHVPVTSAEGSLVPTPDQQQLRAHARGRHRLQPLLVRCRHGHVAFRSLVYRGRELTARDFYNGHLQGRPREGWVLEGQRNNLRFDRGNTRVTRTSVALQQTK